MACTQQGDDRRHWLCIEVRDAQGWLLLLDNPMYIVRRR